MTFIGIDFKGARDFDPQAKLDKIYARIARYNDAADDENGDRHTASPGYTIEDIIKILGGEEPES